MAGIAGLQRWHTGFRRLAFGLRTVLGLGQRGFFIPYRYAARLPRAGQRKPYAPLEPLFAAAVPQFLAVLDSLEAYAAEFRAIAAGRGGGPAGGPPPRWDQGWFPRLDAAVAYAMVRQRDPSRIVEVGSGHSTRFLARAARDGGLQTRITAIDPAPRARFADERVKLLSGAVPGVGLKPFGALAPADILFIDSSHVLMPGSDVDFLLNRVVPRLLPGTLLHIHDVFLPDDYPAPWAWRGYNEQLGVAILLQGDRWRLRFASRYVVTRLAARLQHSIVAALPQQPGSLDSSLWLERVG